MKVNLLLLLFLLTFGVFSQSDIESIISKGKESFINGDFDRAFKYFDKAVTNSDDKTLELANTYFLIGRIFADYSMDDLALKQYFYAISECERIDNSELLQQEIYNYIGGSYFNRLYYEKSRKYWNIALQINREIGNVKGESNNLNNLGEIEFKTGNNKTSSELYSEAFLLKKFIKDTSGLSTVSTNLANVYIKLNELDSAELYLSISQEYTSKLGSNHLWQYLYKAYGNFYSATGNDEAAKNYYKLALEMDSGRMNPDLSVRKDIYRSLIRIYKNLGETDSVYHYYESLNSLEDTLFEKEKGMLKAADEVDLYINKKEHELATLNNKIQFNNLVTIALVVVMLLILILALLLSFQRRRTMRHKTELLKKEENLLTLKSQFISRASHEFRTPLSVIKSNLGIIDMITTDLDNNHKEKFERAKRRIDDSILEITDLMDELLIIGGFSLDPSSLVLEKVDLREVCKKVVSRYRNLNPDRDIDFKVTGESESVVSNEKMIGRVINNVVKNAIRFSNPGDRINFTLIYSKDGVQMKIVDTGIGISSEDVPRIFEPFFRGNNAKVVKGVGLGLTIANEIIKLLNGTISVQSILNDGTTVIIELQN